jgi:methionyl aminopeptidase
MNNNIKVKSASEIKKMTEGGKKLVRVKQALFDLVDEGVSAYQVEELANKLIKKEGAKASFKMVPGYSWATCVNVNEGVVHGIPKKEMVFKKNDLVSVDVGVYFKGYHTDTSFSKGVSLDAEKVKFFKAGEKALSKAIAKAKAGNRVYDISEAIQNTIEASGYSPIRALVGHGVGKELHEDPQIPCFTFGRREDSLQIPEGAVLAIEVMYALGNAKVALEDDGWTISTHDGKISALFEETVAVTKNGPIVLTQ